MKLSTLKKLIKEEINRTLKEEAGSVSVSPDASGSDYQHLISLFNGIVSKNEDLNGVRGFIDLGKNVDAYMDTLAYLSDEDAEEMKEEPVLVMKKGPYEIIFDSESYNGSSYFYHLSFVKNGQLDDNADLYGAEGDAKILTQMPLVASYLNTGEAGY